MTSAVSSSLKAESIRVYLKIKWLVLALLVLVNVFEVTAGLVSLIAAVTVFCGVFLASLLAILLEWYIRKDSKADLLCRISLLIDVLLIVLALYFNGGLENSWLFLPIFVIFLASHIFGSAAGFSYAGFSFVAVLLMSLLQYFGLIPHFPLFKLPEAHWRNIQYLGDYMTGMFVLYFASAFAIGALTQFAASRAERSNEYEDKLHKLSQSESDLKDKIRQGSLAVLIKNAELERLQAHSFEQQLKLIELKQNLEELKRT
jgi:hypothetical protein